MYRKAAVLVVGGYLTEYFPEDYFLWLRMLKNGSKFYNIQESLLWFRYSEETVAKRGGWAYACDEVRILVRMLKMGYIPFHVFLPKCCNPFYHSCYAFTYPSAVV